MKKVWLRMLAGLVVLCVAAGAVLVGCVYVRSRVQREIGPADCIIVLGARVWQDGRPSDALQYRLNSAMEAYEQGLADTIIVCGAQGGNEPATEASVMRKVLMEGGVPESAILVEDQSYNTEQNLENACAIMRDEGFVSAIVITSDYHLERALWLARDAGIGELYGIPSASPRPFFTIWRLRAREAASWVMYCMRKMF